MPAERLRRKIGTAAAASMSCRCASPWAAGFTGADGVTAGDGGATTAAVAVEIHGEADPRFGRVREAFAENFAHHAEVGAACCVYHRGRPVVDLWAGMADPTCARPWTRETTTLVLSSTKGITAACVLWLVERGVLDLAAPVPTDWPGFDAARQEALPLPRVLCRRGCVPLLGAPPTPQH